MHIEREPRRSRAVNLTPLIDVVFLLIVFFMLSTSFVVSESLELNIPSSGPSTDPGEDIWVLYVQEDGQVRSGNDHYSVSELDQQVRRKLSANPEQKMLVLAGAKTSVQQLVSVLDVIYVNGGRKVQIDHRAKTTGAEVQLK